MHIFWRYFTTFFIRIAGFCPTFTLTYSVYMRYDYQVYWVGFFVVLLVMVIFFVWLNGWFFLFYGHCWKLKWIYTYTYYTWASDRVYICLASFFLYVVDTQKRSIVLFHLGCCRRCLLIRFTICYYMCSVRVFERCSMGMKYICEPHSVSNVNVNMAKEFRSSCLWYGYWILGNR